MERNSTILILSLPLAGLIIFASLAGLLSPGFYTNETPDWQIQCVGQDFIDLFLLVPVFLIASYFAWRNKRTALLIWEGCVVFILYTFLIYCFDVHFNRLFIIYCFILGLSFYSCLYFIWSPMRESFSAIAPGHRILNITTIYFFIIASLFYALWLSEILPAIMHNQIPGNLDGMGLPTNPVHVIDLSVFLPGIFITAIFMMKRKPLGLLMAPVLLVFFVLMDLTIGWLSVIMKWKGMGTDVSLSFVMMILAIVSTTLLIQYLATCRLSVRPLSTKVN